MFTKLSYNIRILLAVFLWDNRPNRLKRWLANLSRLFAHSRPRELLAQHAHQHTCKDQHKRDHTGPAHFLFDRVDREDGEDCQRDPLLDDLD